MRILSIIQPSEMGSDFRFEDDVWKVNFPTDMGGNGIPLSTDANNAIGLGSDNGAFISTDLLNSYALTQDNNSKKINLYRFPVGTDFDPETAVLVSSINLIELNGVFDDVAIDGSIITFTDADTGLTLTIDTANLQRVSDINGSDSINVMSEGGVTTLSVKVSPNPQNIIEVSEEGLFVPPPTDVDLHQTLSEVETGLLHVVGNSHLVVPQIELVDVTGKTIGYINDLIGLPVNSVPAPINSDNCHLGMLGVRFSSDMWYGDNGEVRWEVYINGVKTDYVATSNRTNPDLDGWLEKVIGPASNSKLLGTFSNGSSWFINTVKEQILVELKPTTKVDPSLFMQRVTTGGMIEEDVGTSTTSIKLNSEDFIDPDGNLKFCLAPFIPSPGIGALNVSSTVTKINATTTNSSQWLVYASSSKNELDMSKLTHTITSSDGAYHLELVTHSDDTATYLFKIDTPPTTDVYVNITFNYVDDYGTYSDEVSIYLYIPVKMEISSPLGKYALQYVNYTPDVDFNIVTEPANAAYTGNWVLTGDYTLYTEYTPPKFAGKGNVSIKYSGRDSNYNTFESNSIDLIMGHGVFGKDDSFTVTAFNKVSFYPLFNDGVNLHAMPDEFEVTLTDRYGNAFPPSEVSDINFDHETGELSAIFKTTTTRDKTVLITLTLIDRLGKKQTTAIPQSVIRKSVTVKYVNPRCIITNVSGWVDKRESTNSVISVQLVNTTVDNIVNPTLKYKDVDGVQHSLPVVFNAEGLAMCDVDISNLPDGGTPITFNCSAGLYGDPNGELVDINGWTYITVRDPLVLRYVVGEEPVTIGVGRGISTVSDQWYEVDWKDGNGFTLVKNSSSMTISTPGEYTLEVSNVGTANAVDDLVSIGVANKDVSDARVAIKEVVSFGTVSTWLDLSNLEGLVKVPETFSKTITNAKNLFKGCSNLNDPNIKLWNTEKLVYIDSMFSDCTSFNQDLSDWDFSNVVTAMRLFVNCSSLTTSLKYPKFNKLIKSHSMCAYTGLGLNYDFSTWCIPLLPQESIDSLTGIEPPLNPPVLGACPVKPV